MDSLPENAIAVVGMSCRFPGGASDPEKFWAMLMKGTSAWSEVPADRFSWNSFYHPDPDMRGTLNHRGGHFLKQDLAAFDCSFFGISPAEAQGMDPQQRLQLETAFEAIDSAGILLEDLKGSDTAVYIATFSRDHDHMMHKDTSYFAKSHMSGSGDAILANRISYVFDLKGPSMTLDTGCSGSMVALHQACQSLKIRECGLALIGGCNLILSPDQMIPMSLAHVLNSNGKCYPFDSRGSGYGRGEGAATIVLKRLEDAIKAGDNIRAVIRQSALNHDGKTSGMAMPSQAAQEDLIQSIYREAGLELQDVGYVEAHGTGTEIGDAVESNGLINAFCNNQKRTVPLVIGSVKGNIGHLESASGVAGLIKTILMLEKGWIPPTINLSDLKSGLSFPSDIRIATSAEAWPDHSGNVRIASVNSFGYGGTNGHAILQSWSSKSQNFTGKLLVNGAASSYQRSNGNEVQILPLVDCTETSRHLTNGHIINGYITNGHSTSPQCQGILNDEFHSSLDSLSIPYLFMLSAKSEKSLLQSIDNLQQWAASQNLATDDLRNLSFTLCCRKSFMQWRYSFAASNPQEVIDLLGHKSKQVCKALLNVKPIFIFTGQGAQWIGMGRELLLTQKAFKRSLLESDQILRGLGLCWSLTEELCQPETKSRIHESTVAQPAVTAIQIALVDLLHEFGVKPHAVLGHSSGEIAAAYCSGVLSRSSALKVSYFRSLVSNQLAQSTNFKGAMMAVGLSQEQLPAFVAQVRAGRIDIACLNSSLSITVSGDFDAILELESLLRANDIFARILKVDIAYHSFHMRQVADDYLRLLDGLEYTSPRIIFVSSVTATEKIADFSPSYWVENLVSKVRFSEALTVLAQTQGEQLGEESRRVSTYMHTLIEVGPHKALAGPIRQTLSAASLKKFNYSYFPTLVRDQDDRKSILQLVGNLFQFGHSVDLASVLDFAEHPKPTSVLSTLPAYPWDHSTSYWHESRLSKEHRFRKDPYHDLLGVRIVGGTPNQPSWRIFLGHESHPWLADHVVDSFPVFPGSGYICMAIEGLRQILRDRQCSRACSQFVFRDIRFSKALVIIESPGIVEVRLHLRSSPSSTEKSFTGWEEFVISSVSQNETWSEHCRGLIGAELATTAEDTELSQQIDFQHQLSLDFWQEVSSLSSQVVLVEKLYKDCRKAGNDYGPMFAAIQELRTGNCCALASVGIVDVAKSMPSNFMEPHVIHPTTLDAIFQVGLPLYRSACSQGSVMPVEIDRLTIKAEMATIPTSTFQVATRIAPLGPRLANMHTVACQYDEKNTLQPVIEFSGAELRGVGEVQNLIGGQNSTRNVVYQMKWGSDTPRKPERVNSMDTEETVRSSKFAEKDKLLNRCGTLYIDRFLRDSSELEIPKEHHRRLVRWMQKFRDSPAFTNLLEGMTSADIDSTVELAKDAGVEGEMITRTGTQLQAIIGGKMDALSVLLEDDLLYRLYTDDSSVSCYNHLVNYLKEVTFKKPYLKVLEIGAGTGGTTKVLFQAHDQNSGSFFRQYDYTDISSGFFEQAQTSFAPWTPLINFKTLDIEKDLIAQGFEAASYDLIIASNVIHATKSLKDTLKNVRKLLKEDGELAMIEIVNLSPVSMSVFGLLPGWWAGVNDGREEGPLLTVPKWNATLLESGFRGAELVANDFEGATGGAHKTALIVTGPQNNSNSTLALPSADINLICIADANENTDINQILLSALQYKGLSVRETEYGTSLENIPDGIFIVLDTGAAPVLVNPDIYQFQTIQKLIAGAHLVFWISGPYHGSYSASSLKGLITGFAGTARAENTNLKLITFDIQDQIADSKLEPLAHEILERFTRSMLHDTASDQSMEFDFVYRDGEVLIPRLIPEYELNDRAFVSDASLRREVTSFQQDTRSLKLHVETPGLLDSLIFIDDVAVDSPLAQNSVEIRVAAFGVNFKDVFIALGQMKSARMTGECAGTVTRVGSGMETRFSIGDRVCCFDATPYASKARVLGHNVHKIPPSMSFVVAASIPVIFTTAWYGLVEIAKLQPGQTVLIHAASGGVGQAALKIAQRIGAEIFATVGSETKAELLTEQYGIPRSHIFSSRNRRFKQGILMQTRGKGVDVVLNSSSGESLHDSWSCIARFGVFIEIGKTDIYNKSQLRMEMFEKGATFTAIDLGLITDHRPEYIQRVLVNVMSLLSSGELSPVHPITKMPIGDIELAFRNIQSRKHIGKVVLEVDPSSLVTATAPRSSLKLEADGTYLIVGGLGDLGLHVAGLFAARGAGHLVLLSRNAATHPEGDSRLTSIESLGTKVHIMSCDICDTSAMDDMIAYCAINLPPIKGVIQAAMVLQDSLIEHMSPQDFRKAMEPKALGTKYLYDATMEHGIDFFVMLSSSTSIVGFQGQANYAAGNGFQDYLANHHPPSKSRYISISLGMIEDSDVIKLHPERVGPLARAGALPIKLREFMEMLEALLSDPSWTNQNTRIVVGFDRKSLSLHEDIYTLRNPLFRHLPHSSTTSISTHGNKSEEIILDTKDPNELQQIVSFAISKKIATLLAHKSGQIDLDIPISELGLDSLIAIELKNWIGRTFQAPIQTSEILDMASISALASTTIARSSVIANRDGTTEVNGVIHKQKLSSSEGLEAPSEPKLPQLPLPDLESTLQLYRQSVLPFCSEIELAEVDSAIEGFLNPKSVGYQLQERLKARTTNPEIDGWQYELYNNHVYLDARYPISPFQQMAGWIPSDESKPLKQAESAALISLAAFNFKQDLTRGLIKPDTLNDQPLCMFSLRYLFNCVREPRTGRDIIREYPDNDYMIAIRSGRCFKISLKVDGESVSFDSLLATLEAILTDSDGTGDSIATLTAEDRETWALVRKRVRSQSKANRKALETVEAAAFVLCLDDANPKDSTQRWNQYMLGPPSNRWSDKSLQLVVCRDGTMGTLVDHSAIDGGSLSQLHARIIQTIQAHHTLKEQAPPKQSNGTAQTSSTSHASLEGLKFDIDEQTKADISRVEQMFASVCASIPSEVGHYSLGNFGSTFLRSHNCSPKTGAQLLIQLASRMYFGYQPPSWETVTLRQFHKGRVDIIQVVLPAVAAFCKAAVDDPPAIAKIRGLFHDAAKEYTTTLMKVSRGKGFAGHLYALQEVCHSPEEQLPTLFAPGSMYQKTRPTKILTSSVEIDSRVLTESGFVMPDAEFVFVHYEIKKQRCKFYIKGPPGKTKDFFESLRTAASIVEVMLSAK